MDYKFILLAAVLSLLAGVILNIKNDEKNRKKLVRTAFMVIFGAALLTRLSVTKFAAETNDFSRIPAQIISSVGFLGAGIIFFRKNFEIEGVENAANIWLSSVIGILLGLKLYHEMAIVSLIIAFVLYATKLKLLHLRTHFRISAKISAENFDDRALRNVLKSYKISFQLLSAEKIGSAIRVDLELAIPKDVNNIRLMHEFEKLGYTEDFKIIFPGDDDE